MASCFQTTTALFLLLAANLAGAAAAPPRFRTLDEYARYVSQQLQNLSEAEQLYVGLRIEGESPSLDMDDMKLMSWGTRRDTFEVTQVLDGHRALIKFGSREWLLRGLPTSGFVDGGHYSAKDRVLFIHGTETLTTVLGGARTVGVINFVDSDAVKDVLVGSELIRRGHNFESVGDASFMEIKLGMVTLVRPDLTTEKLKLSDLPSADRDWINDFNAKELAARREREKQRKSAVLKRKK